MDQYARLRSPFSVRRLPLLARLHGWGFCRREARPPIPIRLGARAAFYLLRRFSRGPVYGQMQVDVGGSRRTAQFDARNRQFAALYFDAYASGYEPEVESLIDFCIGERGTFYDIGSNWGYFSIYLAARPGYAGRIHAFEPWPSSFRDLNSIVEQLGLRETISCHPFALGQAAGCASMQAGSHSGLAHLAEDGRGTKVYVRNLDQLEFDPPDFIKIDVEGHEESVLRGGQGLLTEHRPMVVFEHRRENDRQWNNAFVLQYLRSLGYHLFAPRCVDRTLALLDLDIDQRKTYTEDANLLACHESRLNEIAVLRATMPNTESTAAA